MSDFNSKKNLHKDSLQKLLFDSLKREEELKRQLDQKQKENEKLQIEIEVEKKNMLVKGCNGLLKFK